MQYKYSAKIFFFLIGLAISTPAFALPEGLAPMQLKGMYEFRFTGVLIGKMGLEIQQQKKSYDITSDIISSGALKMFVSHSSHTTVRESGPPMHQDVLYQSNYQTRKKKKSVAMRYVDSEVLYETLVPPDNRATRPEVLPTEKKGSYDPLSIILKIREELYMAKRDGRESFQLNAYDGRRLTQVDFKMAGTRTLTWQDTPTEVLVLDVRRKQLAGFTKNEIEDYNPKEPTLHIYFTNDERLIPIRLEAKLLLGTVSANLNKECPASESCLLGIKE